MMSEDKKNSRRGMNVVVVNGRSDVNTWLLQTFLWLTGNFSCVLCHSINDGGSSCSGNSSSSNNKLRRTRRSPSTATCHPATCSFLWLSRLRAHWLMMDTRSFGRLAGGLHYALLIHGKPLFSTNASWLRFSDLTQYAWPTHFQFPSPLGNHSRDFTNLLSFYAPGNEVPVGQKKIIRIIAIDWLPRMSCHYWRLVNNIYFASCTAAEMSHAFQWAGQAPKIATSPKGSRPHGSLSPPESTL